MVSSGGGLSHLHEDVLHLVTLSLSANVRSEALLDELQSLLVLGDTEQLHSATLVGGESGDLADELTDKLKK